MKIRQGLQIILVLYSFFMISFSYAATTFLTSPQLNVRGGLKITASGLYAFSEDITFTQINQTAITITADDVTIDFNGKTLRSKVTYGTNIAINVVTSNDKVLGKIRNHVIIKDGVIDNFNRYSILVGAGMRNLTVANLSVISAKSNNATDAPTGLFLNGDNGVPIRDIMINNCRFDNGRYGVFSNATNNADMINSLCSRTFSSGVVLNQSNVWRISNCHFSNQIGTTGFLAQGCTFLSIKNSDFCNVQSSADSAGLYVIGLTNGLSGGHIIDRCSFNSNKAGSGFSQGLAFVDTSSSLIRNCVANGNFSLTGFGVGYYIASGSSGNLFENCVADGNYSLGTSAAGYYVEGTGNDFFSCVAKTNQALGFGGTGVGFNVTALAMSCSLQNCTAIANTEGFRNDGMSTVIGGFASGNGTNYAGIGILGFVTIVNGVQPPGGSFDERQIDNISIV